VSVHWLVLSADVQSMSRRRALDGGKKGDSNL